MKSEMAKRLKEVLDSSTQEEFDADWTQIEKDMGIIRIHEDSYVIKNFLNDIENKSFFDKVLNEVTWHKTLKSTDDKEITLKRKMAYVYDKPVNYGYDKFTLPGMTWVPSLLSIKNILESKTKYEFNSVLLNLYENGKDEIRWHPDKEKQLGDNPVIACINLGAGRTFHFLRLSDGFKTSCFVEGGDLLVMEEDCQKKWLHAILKESSITEPRISLTFRKVYEEKF